MPRPSRFFFFVALAVLTLGASTAAASPSDESSKEEIRFDGHPIRRVSVAFRDDSCAGAYVANAIDVAPRRSPHAWYKVTTSSADHTPAYEHFLDVAPIVTSTTSPLTTKHAQTLRMVQVHVDGEPFAHSFEDPRFVRLHDGHHDPTLDEAGRRLQADELARRNRFDEGHADTVSRGRHHHQHAVEAHAKLPVATEAFWIPQSVDQIEIFCNRSDVPDVVLHVPKPGHDLHHSSTHEFRAKADAATPAAKPEVQNLANIGPPHRTFNIIFVSGGFREEDKEMFFKNASAIHEMMRDRSLDPKSKQYTDSDINDMHRTVPFDRYWHNWNVYAVYQASIDNGANRPLYGLKVQNNLGCTHPQEVERAVFCDRDKAQALAAASPGDVMGDPNRNIVVAIVNTNIYGGSAISLADKLHMGNFFNGFDLNDVDELKRMLSLVNHELGHAFGDLMDEYSIGVNEPTDKKLQNCMFNLKSELKWQHWVDIKNKDPKGWAAIYGAGLVTKDWDVLAEPQAVCGFTNYYKANENCMMHRLNDFFMCPVCREGATRSVLKVHFDLDWPRQPLRDVVTVVVKDPATVMKTPGGPAAAGTPVPPTPAPPTPAPTPAPPGPTPTPDPSAAAAFITTKNELALHLPVHLTRGYTIKVTDYDGADLPLVKDEKCPNCVILKEENFVKYPLDTEVEIRVDITDSTDFFIASEKILAELAPQLNQRTTFRVMVASSIAAVSATGKDVNLTKGLTNGLYGKHPSDLVDRYTYCEAANKTANESLVCTMDFPTREYEQPRDVEGELANYDQWVLIGLGIMAVVFLLLWAWAATACNDKANGEARSIFETEFSCIIRLIRRVMMVSSVLFLVSSVAAIGVSAYFYYHTSTLGKILLAGGVALAVVLYLMAFFGYWAVASRSKRMLIINAVILFIALGVMVFLFAVVMSLGKELQVETTFKIEVGDVASNAVGAAQNQTEAAEKGYWSSQLESLWIKTVHDDSNTACALEGMLQCSGYFTNCASEFASTLTCPQNCEETNHKYLSPCQALLRGYIVDNYVYIAGATGGSSGLLLGGLFLNIVLLVSMCCAKKKVQQDNEKRIARVRPSRPSGAGGAAAGVGAGAGAKVASDAMPDDDTRFKALYLLRSLDTSSTTALVREFKRIDIDGNGQLSRTELFVFFKKVLVYKPSAAELDEIFRIADTDKSGEISFTEFLTLFGCTDPQAAKDLMAKVQNPRRDPRAFGMKQMMKIRRKKQASAAAAASMDEPPTMATTHHDGAEPLLSVPHQEAKHAKEHGGAAADFDDDLL